ncbi:MAG: MerR family transcriptional regulator, partial [Caldilineaceae bacterium SB0665_bin_21]|nr:MerR family transcriptional regulator [Caldilineaceae bacterium SB0665_bin_21]
MPGHGQGTGWRDGPHSSAGAACPRRHGRDCIGGHRMLCGTLARRPEADTGMAGRRVAGPCRSGSILPAQHIGTEGYSVDMKIHRAAAFAAKIGVHKNTVKAWSLKGKLPDRRTPAGHRYYTEADVDRYFGV